MSISLIIVGILLLFAGRSFFWFFVGIIGFIYGFEYASKLLTTEPTWMILLVSFLCGAIGIVLAIFIRRLAISLAGFLYGGYILSHAWTLFLGELFYSTVGSVSYWIIFLVGGIIGSLMSLVLFEWALIILSSLAGAMLLTLQLEVFQGLSPLHFPIFIGLSILGLLVQTAQFLGHKNKKPQEA